VDLIGQEGVLWVALLIGGIITGASVVGILVVPRVSEALCALAGILGFAGSSFALAMISDSYGRADASLYGFAFMLAAGAGGYALASTLLYRLNPTDAPDLPLGTPKDGDAGTAVIVFACCEPERYGPRDTARMLQSLTDEELLQASVGALPLLFFAQKTRYRAVGGVSPATGELLRIAEGLELALNGSVSTVDWATCQGPRALRTRVKAAAEAGHRRIVITELSVASSLGSDAARRAVDGLRPGDAGVNVRYTGVLSDAERIPAMLVSRALSTATDLSQTGFVLVGHGQPEERAKRNPRFDEEEAVFLNRLRMILIDRGVPQQNVRIAWSEWRTPDVTSAVRHVAALGCTRAVVVPAVFPLDTIATRLDLEIAVRHARADQTAGVITLTGWRDDPALIEELRARVSAAQEGPGGASN